jgi:holo-[acyl-carrier-protein] synthase
VSGGPVVCGIGADLADVRRMARWRSRFSDDVLTSVFTARELAEAGRAAQPGLLLAVSLAGKEACGKALGRGLVGLAWTDIEVASEPGDAVSLTLSGDAAVHERRAGVRAWTGAWTVVAGHLVLVQVIGWSEEREMSCPDM